MAKLMKLVSTSTWYGGPSCALYWKNSAVDTFSLRRGCFDVSMNFGNRVQRSNWPLHPPYDAQMHTNSFCNTFMIICI